MTAKVILEELLTSKLETIQKSTLESLEPSQTADFKAILANLETHVDDTPDRKATLVFRGTKLEQLRAQLSTKRSRVNEKQLLERLFYFGNKARDYHKHKDVDPAAKKLHWIGIPRIEDASEETCSAIFDRIREVLQRPKSQSRNFCNSNKEFRDFFFADNLSTFTSRLADDQNCSGLLPLLSAY